jgi:Holliday junction resolvase RusA-like endonuclease
MSKSGRVFAHVYEPGRKDSPARQWKSDIRQEAARHIKGALLAGPLSVKIDFYFPRPQSLMRLKDPDGRIPHAKRPDRDNCDKAVLDALKGVLFVDDCQACCGEVRKFYHEKDGRPRAEIHIEEIV